MDRMLLGNGSLSTNHSLLSFFLIGKSKLPQFSHLHYSFFSVEPTLQTKGSWATMNSSQMVICSYARQILSSPSLLPERFTQIGVADGQAYGKDSLCTFTIYGNKYKGRNKTGELFSPTYPGKKKKLHFLIMLYTANNLSRESYDSTQNPISNF